MATYAILTNWTQDGIKEVKKSPARLNKVKQAFKEAGGRVKTFYMAMGRYDMVVIAEAPDDETIAKLALMVGSAGSVRTETLRLFPEPEYRKIIQSLP